MRVTYRLCALLTVLLLIAGCTAKKKPERYKEESQNIFAITDAPEVSSTEETKSSSVDDQAGESTEETSTVDFGSPVHSPVNESAENSSSSSYDGKTSAENAGECRSGTEEDSNKPETNRKDSENDDTVSVTCSDETDSSGKGIALPDDEW